MGKIYVLGVYLPPSVLIAALYLSVMIIVVLCIVLRNNRLKHEDLKNKFAIERASRIFFEETELKNYGVCPSFETLDKLDPEFLRRYLYRLKDFYGWRFFANIQRFRFFEMEIMLKKAKDLKKNWEASELVRGAIKGSFLTLNPSDFAHLIVEAARSEFWLNLDAKFASKIFTSGVENEKAKANIQWFIEIAEELLSDKLPLANRRWWKDAERLAPEIKKALREERITFLADPKNTVELKSHVHNRVMEFEKEISKKP